MSMSVNPIETITNITFPSYPVIYMHLKHHKDLSRLYKDYVMDVVARAFADQRFSSAGLDVKIGLALASKDIKYDIDPATLVTMGLDTYRALMECPRISVEKELVGKIVSKL